MHFLWYHKYAVETPDHLPEDCDVSDEGIAQLVFVCNGYLMDILQAEKAIKSFSSSLAALAPEADFQASCLQEKIQQLQLRVAVQRDQMNAALVCIWEKHLPEQRISNTTTDGLIALCGKIERTVRQLATVTLLMDEEEEEDEWEEDEWEEDEWEE